MVNSRSGIKTFHSLNIHQNRPAVSLPEETKIVGDAQERSALPSPNRAAHERLKSQQLQQMLNKNSGANSTPWSASFSYPDQAVNVQGKAAFTSESKNDSQAEPSEPGIWGMAKILSNLLPWNWIKLSPREELQLNFTKIKKHFEALKAGNWSPDEREFYCDVALLPIAVKAENAREPKLNLHHFDSFHSFASVLKGGNLQNGRTIFPLLGKEAHAVAADIRVIDDKVSILILEPLGMKDVIGMYGKRALEMSKVLPENAKLAVLSVDAQKAANGCRIFALSAASKLAKESEFFDELHEANAYDQVQAFKRMKKSEIESRLSTAQLGDDPVDVYQSTDCQNFRYLDAHRLVPASFQKHTQAKSSLKAWADEDKLAQVEVNKKGETLLSRFQRHAVNRYKRDFLHDGAGNIQWGGMKQVRFSASIEEKRLTYIDRAIAYLDKVPQEEISDFLHHFYGTLEKYKLPDELPIVAAYDIAKSEVGPLKMLNRPYIDI